MIQDILMASKYSNVNYLVILEVNYKMCNNNKSVIIISYQIIFQVVNLDAHIK